MIFFEKLNYLFVNLLILIAFYGLLTEKGMDYRGQLIIILIVLTLLYNIVNVRESFINTDFGQPNRASLDIFMPPPPPGTNSLKDRCGKCSGMCVCGITGRNYPAPANTLCREQGTVKNIKGRYFIESVGYPNKYFSYDLQEGSFYLATPNERELFLSDLQWNIEPYGESNYRLSTVNQPSMYLYLNAKGRLDLSYIPYGEWLLLNANNGILIRTAQPNLYLTSDGRNVVLSDFLDYWQLKPVRILEKFETNPTMKAHGPTNILSFPDDKRSSKIYGSGVGEWSKYYSEFWNGEYIYKNTTPTNNDYLTVHLLPDGSGTISTKKETWNVLSISPELLYGDNKNSYIYLEMLTAAKGGQFYDPNRPQIKILTRDKNSMRPQYKTLVSCNPNNLNTYGAKIGNVGDNVKRYTAKGVGTEQYANLPISLLMSGVNYLGTTGYNLPSINVNVKKPCVLSTPKDAPTNTGYWASIDKTGKLKGNSTVSGEMEMAYTYLYQCVDGTTEETPRSPILHLPTSVGAGGVYYGALVNITGDKDAKSYRIYVKGPGDGDYKMMQEIMNPKTVTKQVEVAVIPDAVKKILEN